MGLERDVVAMFAPGSRAALAYEALWMDIQRRLRAPDSGPRERGR